ncbi:hypothetical protein [Hymenobacter sp.]|uniref:hypothetical protein n=1 Tax=Hymenobacter sp. TaxID=1898978 RepID=UPI00286ADA92|nr:hypothetical protein [Hymenobacter sp.]
MKILVYYAFFGWLPFASGLVGCSSERVALGPAPPREQEITRFRRTDPAKEPVVFGRVLVLDKTHTYPQAAAIVSLDDSISFANEAGEYRLIVSPGAHRFLTGQIGILPSQLTLEVERGDSVRINFHLRPDLRPLD